MRVEMTDRSSAPWAPWFTVFLVFLSLYALTASRGVQWQDSGTHTLRVLEGELLNPRGLALTHPLHYWASRAAIAPVWMEPAFAITLVSSFFGAITVANVFACARTLTRSASAAAFAAVSLGFAHTFWKLSTIVEAYTLTTALLSAECWCLAALGRSRRSSPVIAMALLNGLGLANHNAALLTTPIVAVVVGFSTRRRPNGGRTCLAAVVAWVAGSLPYSGLVAREMIRSGDVAATLQSALFGSAWTEQVLAIAPGSRQLVITACFLALNFPNLLLPLSVRGVAWANRGRISPLVRRALFASLAVHFLFALRYPVVDQHTFFLPSYLLLSVFGGVGLASAAAGSSDRRRSRWPGVAWALLLLTPVWYTAAPAAARRAHVLRGVERHKPYRDDYVTFFSPWSVADDSADRMSRHALSLAGADGLIVVEDPMAEAPVRYRVARSGAKGVEITRPSQHDRLEAATERGRIVVLVPLDANAPAVAPPANHRWRREGDLYVLSASASDGS